MSEWILKTGEGILYGLSNQLAQEGKMVKMVKMYDGSIVLGIFQLDKAFPDRPRMVGDIRDTGTVPGIVLDFVFTTELRVETDGKGLVFYWG